MSNLPFTLEQLKILHTISSVGSFKKAAEKLYISQPAVSLQVQNLEKKLGVSLFYRDKRKACLTEAGRFLTKYAERIIDLCEEGCHALDELKSLQTGTLVIGASQTTGTYLMPRLIGIFRHKYPQIDVELHVHSTRTIALGIYKNQFDLAIVGGEIPKELRKHINTVFYAQDELALILPASHPFTSLPYIQKEDLYRLRFIALDTKSTIRNVIESALIQKGIDSQYLKIEMELNSVEAIKNAVQAGLGAAFISVSAISKELDLNLFYKAKIKDVTIKRDLYLLLNPKYPSSLATQIFKKEILEMSVPF